MPIVVDPVAGERIARHGFLDRPAQSVVEAVRHTTAIQAQDAAAARLGVRARSGVVTEVDVHRALDDERTVVRTWLMRATIHLVTAADVRWLTAVIGPSFARKFAKRWRDMGLTTQLLDRTAEALPDVLAGGPLPLSQIMAGLADHGTAVPLADPQAPYHVMLHASGLGLVCRGPHRGREATFALVDQWLPAVDRAGTAGTTPGPRGDDALAELARRYFAAFSPATAADFSTWSGLPSSQAIGLIRDELTPVSLNGRPGFTLGEQTPNRGLRMLGAFDNYLIGYRDRAGIVDTEHRARVYVGGVIKATVLLDGRVIGTWRLARSTDAATVSLQLFQTPSRAIRHAVDAEVADIGRFLGTEAVLDLSVEG
jgi:hypothetical protein